MTSQHDAPTSTAEIAYPEAQELDAASTPGVAEPQSDAASAQLLGSEQSESLSDEWTAIQAKFVDDPRDAVQGADALVATVIQELARTFADERASLEKQWDRDEDVDTEALRLALQRYRSFFHRLLAA
jgi:hypothetical protein